LFFAMRRQMAIEAIVRGVDSRAAEPAHIGRLPIEDGGPFLEPVQLLRGQSAPELSWMFFRLRAERIARCHIGNVSVGAEFGRRGNYLVIGHQRDLIKRSPPSSVGATTAAHPHPRSAHPHPRTVPPASPLRAPTSPLRATHVPGPRTRTRPVAPTVREGTQRVGTWAPSQRCVIKRSSSAALPPAIRTRSR